MKRVVGILLFAGLGFAYRSADLRTEVRVPQSWPRPVYPFGENARAGGYSLHSGQVALGRALFFEPLLSRDGSISCASCHLPQTAFTHVDHDLSHGIEGRIGTRNSPALMNLAWSSTFMWDGAVHHLDVQSLAPITHHDEMDETLEAVVRKLRSTPGYAARYAAAYGDTMVTGQHTLQSLAQFMLTLVSADSRYDKVMRGEATFNTGESHGYQLFQTHCASCHREPLFTTGGFENNGLAPDSFLRDEGRKKITGRAADLGRFKVPTLRNVEVTYPYMHDGRFGNLQMVLFHYTQGIHTSGTLSPALRKPIRLNEEDKRDLILFLRTLTDESFLHNPDFQPRQAP